MSPGRCNACLTTPRHAEYQIINLILGNITPLIKQCSPKFRKTADISSTNPLPNISSSISTFSTSSSSTQENLLPSPSGILPTIQSESLLQTPIPTTTTTTSPGNNLNTLVLPLETETRSHTTPDKLNSVSTENLPESLSLMHPIVTILMQLKPNNLSRNAAPTEITTDDEDMITYDVEEEELQQDPPNKFTIDEKILTFYLKDTYVH
ncbi:hypothetical protein TNCV_1884021 [Trichonephila clavipes]|nr:hypothetical protein TNCV_1884021 [Trichonephila clavipes]